MNHRARKDHFGHRTVQLVQHMLKLDDERMLVPCSGGTVRVCQPALNLASLREVEPTVSCPISRRPGAAIGGLGCTLEEARQWKP